MSLFYVDKNTQDNGDHEIHTASCSHSPGLKNCDALGYHTACSTALDAAKKYILNQMVVITVHIPAIHLKVNKIRQQHNYLYYVAVA